MEAPTLVMKGTMALLPVAYQYMDDLHQWDLCRARHPVQLPRAMNGIDTPLNWREWDRCLQSHPDQRFQQYLVEGIRDGFRVGFDYRHARALRSSRNNLPSVGEHPQVVNEYLAKECSEGRVLGPLDPGLFPQVHVSKFGVIPKGLTGKWRLIVDMSHPEGASTNDGISESLSSLTYVGIDDATRAIQFYGKGALLAKVDIKSAYRNVPVHPDDRWLMGMSWEGSLFIDTALPFGLRSAPKIFTAIAAVEWIAKQTGVNFVIHYLDDFLVVGAPSSPECATALRTLLEIFGRLGLPVAMEKLEGPVMCLGFLGFELDTLFVVLTGARGSRPPGEGTPRPHLAVSGTPARLDITSLTQLFRSCCQQGSPPPLRGTTDQGPVDT